MAKMVNTFKFTSSCVVGGQYIRLTHLGKKTKFVMAKDFVKSVKDFTEDNKFDDDYVTTMVRSVKPLIRPCVDGKSRIAFDIEIERDSMMLWHCVNCIEDDGTQPYPCED